VRVFTVGGEGVLRFDVNACVYAVRYGEIVLWHYAFARHWFKVNVTTDTGGRLVETGAHSPGGGFAFNCDIATPMRRSGNTVLAVDLFTDVLVRQDAVTYRIADLDEFAQAHRDGLIRPAEARGAEHGLAELTGLVERGKLLAFLSRTYPIGPLQPPAAMRPERVPVDQVRLLGQPRNKQNG
jgi:hypothetical protein